MREIRLQNPPVLNNPFTYISTKYTSGLTLTVEDSSGFLDNDLILVGGMGNEQTEVVDVNGTVPTSTTITIGSALSHNHETGESVQKISYDRFDLQFRVDSDSAWQNVTTQTLFDWKSNETVYTHAAGESTYEYRSRYYNSATGLYSAYSDTISGGGLARNQVGFVIRQARKYAKDNNGVAADDETLIDHINDVHDEIKALNEDWWFLRTSQGYTTVADTATYDLPDDCERVDRLYYEYTSGTDLIGYYLKYKTEEEFQYLFNDENPDSDDDLVYYTVDYINNQFEVGPTPETAGYTLTLKYYKSFANVDSFGDTLTIPMTKVYVYYLAAQIYDLKDDEERSKYYMAKYNELVARMKQMKVKTTQPKSLKSYRGRRDFYARRRQYSDNYREKYW